MTGIRIEERMIHAIAGLLDGCRHIAVGVLSPIPGAAAFLTSRRSGARVSLLGAKDPRRSLDGGVELFDLAGQGRIDAFFFSGGQIDGRANINLHGVGAYPQMDARWSGAFGSAYLYFRIPRVILFHLKHERRSLPGTVDFITAPGVSPPGVDRPGGPCALVTNLCVMRFDRAAARFRLESLHPGVTLEEVLDRTGFSFDMAEQVPETPSPTAADLALIRGDVAHEIAGPYPAFAREVFGIAPS